MADQNKSSKDTIIIDLRKQVSNLTADLENERAAHKKAIEECGRKVVHAEAVQSKAESALASIESEKQDAFIGFGPSVLVKLMKDSTAGDGTNLVRDSIIGVMHINEHLNADYLISAIHTGRAKVIPGITDGVFQLADLEALRDRITDLESQLESGGESEQAKTALAERDAQIETLKQQNQELSSSKELSEKLGAEVQELEAKLAELADVQDRNAELEEQVAELTKPVAGGKGGSKKGGDGS